MQETKQVINYDRNDYVGFDIYLIYTRKQSVNIIAFLYKL